MLIRTRQSIAMIADVIIHINNEPLKHMVVAKYIEIYIDAYIKWDEHINIMILKMSTKEVPRNIVVQLYNAIVQPLVDYGDVTYDSASIATKTILQKQ